MSDGARGRWLVVAQFALLAVLAWPWSPSVTMSSPLAWPWSRPGALLALVPAGVIAALAALVGFWTLAHNRVGNFNVRPEPRVGGRLIVTGPYRYVRHPMYVAVLLVALALVVAYGSALKALCLIALALVLRAKATLEEKALPALYPEYADYARRVGRFVPRLRQ